MNNKKIDFTDTTYEQELDLQLTAITPDDKVQRAIPPNRKGEGWECEVS